ncbi:tRNA lysidine(34) synthetase TilS [Methyloligella sp. 2.7D]|uniref:tRNA lysidine(34) synthetase TilS n=1 Tax=unclassified Methyloligella TaxID=2625955 RepID=UPI001ABA325D|nr:tRNA lysidine(34) synthetase TilS [Methyloligella sp. GL2]
MSSPVRGDEAEALFAGLRASPRLALAVSGGADSLALFYLVHRWRQARDAGPELSVLTVDHGLRPESAGEAAMVAALAAKLGLPHRTLHWTDSAGGPGLQERARQARYRLMAGFCHDNGIPALLTAHHLDDQAETVLMRLRRGSGLDGLAAIPAQGDWAGITIRRPLLDLPKARLQATLREAGIVWAEDASNQDSRFERVDLRQQGRALAALGLTPEALGRTARRLARARDALEAETGRFLADHLRIDPQAGAAGFAALSFAALRDAPEEVALRALSRLIAMIGGQERPVQLSKLEALLAALKAEPGKTRTLGGCRLAPKQEDLRLFREIRRPGLPVIQLRPGDTALWDNRFYVGLGSEAKRPVEVRALGKDGLLAAQEACPWLGALPRAAGAALPSCWRNRRLVSVSCIGLEPPDGQKAPFFTARFVHGPVRRAELVEIPQTFAQPPR